jgi:hypothetical protein
MKKGALTNRGGLRNNYDINKDIFPAEKADQ